MRCRDIAPLLLERELGTLDGVGRAALATHLEGCASCASIAAAERRLTQELIALGRVRSVRIDVQARVMSGLRGTPTHAEDRPSPVQLGWSGAAASFAVIALAAPALLALPRIPAAVTAGGRGFNLARALVRPMLDAAVAIGEVSWDLLAKLVELLAPLAAVLALAEPIVGASLSVATLLAAATVLLVTRRDLRSQRFVRGGGS